MADLADDQDVQGTEEDMGDFSSDNHTATRQTEDDISSNVLFAQVMAQSLAGIGAGGKGHRSWRTNLTHLTDLATPKENGLKKSSRQSYCRRAGRALKLAGGGGRLPA